MALNASRRGAFGIFASTLHRQIGGILLALIVPKYICNRFCRLRQRLFAAK
jgi:hypothetical protein